MESQNMNRREFLLVAGGAAAALPLAAFLAGCGGGGGGTAAVLAPGDFVVPSTSVNSHTHNITVRAADLAAGVQVVYTSTFAGSTPHTHTVTITPAQITDINGGKTDAITSSTDLNHNHEFVIKKP